MRKVVLEEMRRGGSGTNELRAIDLHNSRGGYERMSRMDRRRSAASWGAMGASPEKAMRGEGERERPGRPSPRGVLKSESRLDLEPKRQTVETLSPTAVIEEWSTTGEIADPPQNGESDGDVDTPVAERGGSRAARAAAPIFDLIQDAGPVKISKRLRIPGRAPAKLGCQVGLGDGRVKDQ
ncbi:MAG: hypothetical protein AAGD01_13495 [Acidobacteriota bacterium]